MAGNDKINIPSFRQMLQNDLEARDYISSPWQERLPQWSSNCLPETEDATDDEIEEFRKLGVD